MKLTKEQLNEINSRIDRKLISVQKHPVEDLYIYNYTHKVQFENSWDEYTMMCRGLILDGEGNVIARPFSKFFNLDQHLLMGLTLPKEPFEVTEKADGSLGILYFVYGEPYIASRGSFTSEQAIKGTEILRKNYNFGLINPPDNETLLFEIIYPANRIVIDYGSAEKLIFLTATSNDTGRDVTPERLSYWRALFGTVPIKEGVTDIEKLKELEEENKEGFVIRFESGVRVKVKFDEYVRLHRIVTGVNSKNIWECLMKGDGSLEEIVNRVPDEFYKWVKGIAAGLESEFNHVKMESTNAFYKIRHAGSRKDFALAATKTPYAPILFAMYDDRSPDEIIWRQIKPKAERPFREDEA